MANDDTIQRLRDDASRFEAEGIAARDAGDTEKAFALLYKALNTRRLVDRLEQATQEQPPPAHLPVPSEPGTLGTMQTTVHAPSRGAAVSAAMVDRHQNVLLWEVLREHKMSLPELVQDENRLIRAGKLKGFDPLEEGTARSWTKRSEKAGRKIPIKWAERLAHRFKRPDLLKPEAWPKGIRD